MIFDPYDERDFVSGGKATAGPHTITAITLLAATNANTNKNLGA